MRKYRTAFLAMTALVLAAPGLHAQGLPADTDAFLEKAVASGIYPGIIIGLIDSGEVTVKSYGVASEASGKPIEETTLFEIGSISKTFTGVLLAQEVLAGRMAIEDPVQSLLPADVTLRQVGERPMTLADLATHRSGLPRLPADFAPADPADPYADYDAAKLWVSLRTVQPARAPGEAFEYSNLGAGLAGQLVANKAGKSYGDLVRERILEPLGMTQTGTELMSARQAIAAQGHDGSGSAVKYWRFEALAGAGALDSSMHDMLLYLKANMAVAAGAASDTPLHKAMALAQEPRAEAGNGRIGLFWLSSPGKTILMHDGGTYGFSSFIGFTGDGKKGVVILANTLKPEMTSALGVHVLVPSAPLPSLQAEVSLPGQTLAEYVGTYRASGQLNFTVTKGESGLTVQLTGQPAVPVFASSADHFFYKAVPATIDFERAADGTVQRLVLRQSGIRMFAPRIGADGQPVAQPPRLDLDEAALDPYVGRYQVRPGLEISVTREGRQLFVQGPGLPEPSPLFAEMADVFRSASADLDLVFSRDTSGNVSGLTAITSGNEGEARKLPD